MLSTVFLAVCAFLFSFLLTPLTRDFALRLGWVDRPDSKRKTHASPVPRIGGIAIVLAYVVAFAFLLLAHIPDGEAVRPSFPLVWTIMLAAAVVFAIGLLDDFAGLKPWQKLLAEALAASFACFGGIQIQGVAGFQLVPALGIPFTIVWLVGCANAFNLIDGMDGLASGLALLASLTMLVAALLHGDTGLVAAVAPLAGALVGFLLFNFNPASIFLGDCGSLWIGFMLGCYGVLWSQKSATILGITAPLMALCIPLLDMTLSIARRFLRGQPIFKADRGHVHHRLLDRGFTPRRVVLLLYAASALGAMFSLLQSGARSAVSGIVIFAFCATVWAGVQYLSYQEFGMAARVYRLYNLRSMFRSHFSLRGYEEALRAATTVDECWRSVRDVGNEFGFSQVALCLGGRTYQHQLAKNANGQWTLHIPLSDSEYVRLMCQFQVSQAPLVIAPLADLLRQTLSLKAAQFSRAQGAPNLKDQPAWIPLDSRVTKESPSPKAA